MHTWYRFTYVIYVKGVQRFALAPLLTVYVAVLPHLPYLSHLSERNLAMITAEMLAPISTTLSSNLDVLLPIGISIMGTMIGVGLIPRIVYKFL